MLLAAYLRQVASTTRYSALRLSRVYYARAPVSHVCLQVGGSAATLLSKLGIKPFKYGLIPVMVYDNGTTYDPKVSALDCQRGAAGWLLRVAFVGHACLALVFWLTCMGRAGGWCIVEAKCRRSDFVCVEAANSHEVGAVERCVRLGIRAFSAGIDTNDGLLDTVG